MFGLKTAITAGSIIIALLLSFYWYYQNTQKSIARLTEEYFKLEQAVVESEKTVEQLQALTEAANRQLKKTNQALKNSRLQNAELVDRLNNQNLTDLGNAKPNLLEEALNDASNNLSRCFELLSGAELTEKEKTAKNAEQFNSECPWLFNSLFKP